MNLIDKHSAILRFYNATSEIKADVITDIPADRYHVLASMEYKELCKPFIIKDLQAGNSIGQLMRKYNLSQSIIRYIGFKIGLLQYNK